MRVHIFIQKNEFVDIYFPFSSSIRQILAIIVAPCYTSLFLHLIFPHLISINRRPCASPSLTWHFTFPTTFCRVPASYTRTTHSRYLHISHSTFSPCLYLHIILYRPKFSFLIDFLLDVTISDIFD